MWTRRSRQENFANKAVGSLPYASPPKCGLYKASVTTSPPPGASRAIRALHKTILSQRNESCKDTLADRSAYDALSVCSSFEQLSTAVENSVSLASTSRTVSTTVRFVYHVDNNFVISSSQRKRDSSESVAFYFPFSECGPSMESFTVTINDVPLFGEVMRARRSDGRLIPSNEKCKDAFLGETSDMSDDEASGRSDREGKEEGEQAPRTTAPKGAEKLLYYYVAPDIRLTMFLPLKPEDPHGSQPGAEPVPNKDTRGSLANTTPFHVEVSWRCRIVVNDVLDSTDNHMNVVYSLYCTPRYPEYMSLRVELNAGQKIRVLHSPNCRGGVTLRTRIRGATARAHAETVLGDPLRQYRLPGDYLFVFQVFLGDMPTLVEEVSKWGAAAVLVVVAYFTWFFLTRDLIL